ncbi:MULTISPECIES: ubiquinone biosynthesis accessory factor UbiJ [unclassified Agarivorans]|uniref:ubiquinone biosynthesis accessory factor UbiJ n=1 Tax=unclassified Agarivorans TaxID=2636026 RepID=UPI0026E2A95D|nr:MULTISPECIES: SCP2 sterol-binding domain-containing protein [unclassified Agarivorans]MDO6685581.1 SCP2 sterol-binding domain-containing protein [Agarivorans sp. 3_MG-2023]MDO6715967.1 SCP2 sterol-binding domain-containing protein [Agarivorans sp. 2_MG-2023]MDO6765917.1 SCP2 sterol-binding domain-containing protein [Agarivorans sp. 1_MG-2023]
MPFSSLISAGVEALSNQVLALDDTSQARRSQLAGKVLAIKIQPLPCFYFVISEQQLDVLNQFEGQADCSLNLSLFTLAELKQADKIPSLIKQDKLQLEGDIKLAQQFADLFLQLDPDFEEKLSQRVGDVAAYQIVSKGRMVAEALKSLFNKTPEKFTELASEEWKLLVGQLEYQTWQQQVQTLAKDLDSLAVRIQELSE